MKNVHVLPTENYKQDYTLLDGEIVDVVRLGQLIKNRETNQFLLNKNSQWAASCDTDVLVPHHIYITDDSEIKGVKWIIHDGKIHEVTKNKGLYISVKDLRHIDIRADLCKKIILTTDQDLIKDGVQAIDDTFLEWFVKNPSCEWVVIHKLVHKNHFGFDKDKITYKIIIPKEEPKLINNCPKCGLDLIEREGSKPICTDIDCRGIILSSETLREWASKEESKQDEIDFMSKELDIERKRVSKQETLEEAAERLVSDCTLEDKQIFEQGAKWQEERMYSEEELKQFAFECVANFLSNNDNKVEIKLVDVIIDRVNNKFEQFKKKQ